MTVASLYITQEQYDFLVRAGNGNASAGARETIRRAMQHEAQEQREARRG